MNRFIGLLFGLSSVLMAQIVVISYHLLFRSYLIPLEPDKLQPYCFQTALKKHVSNIEGLFLLGVYLSVTYLMNWMSLSYYSFKGGIIWKDVWFQLLLQDFLQYIVHRLEHKFSFLYKHMHKQHHQYKSPKLFDAFSGSIYDTLLMIIIPLFMVSRIIHTNVWSYAAFGTIYSSWLMLIHSEYRHPWDPLFEKIGFGTSSNHFQHHQRLKVNFGHLFMYWDLLGGTLNSKFTYPPN